MEKYGWIVMLLNGMVNFLLLAGTNRVCGCAPGYTGAMAGALLGAVYAGACLLPGFDFLGNTFWRIVSLILMVLLAYGMERSAVRRGAMFVLLQLALNGLLATERGFASALLAAVGLLVICLIGFRGGGGGYVPVTVCHRGNRVELVALRDTGNTLTDPVTGSPVLVIGAQAACKLTGLTVEQLKKPVESMGLIPGLRLIPYQTVGQTGAMMLGMRIKDVRIGSWRGSSLVAFAPEGLRETGKYQALAGGMA